VSEERVFAIVVAVDKDQLGGQTARYRSAKRFHRRRRIKTQMLASRDRPTADQRDDRVAAIWDRRYAACRADWRHTPGLVDAGRVEELATFVKTGDGKITAMGLSSLRSTRGQPTGLNVEKLLSADVDQAPSERRSPMVLCGRYAEPAIARTGRTHLQYQARL
jgi:hypothetical protein